MFVTMIAKLEKFQIENYMSRSKQLQSELTSSWEYFVKHITFNEPTQRDSHIVMI